MSSPSDEGEGFDLVLVKQRGTWRRFILGNIVGTLTAGLIEDDTFEPERFAIEIRKRATGQVLSVVAAGSNPQEAVELLDRLRRLQQELPAHSFLDRYG